MAPKFNRPNVSVISIEMVSANLLQQRFAVKLNIQNPNDRELPVRGLHTELHVGGQQIASGVSDHAFTVAGVRRIRIRHDHHGERGIGVVGAWPTR